MNESFGKDKGVRSYGWHFITKVLEVVQRTRLGWIYNMDTFLYTYKLNIYFFGVVSDGYLSN